MNISHTELNNFVQSVFLAAGFNSIEAKTAADVLVLSDLRGIESHGTARLPGYIRLVDLGIIKPNAKPKIERERLSTLTIDGDGGLGLYIASYAMDLAIQKAKATGSGWAAINNSSHFGIAGAHAKKALEQDMIGFAMTNASPLVAPAGGTERLLGTNPICWCFPSAKQEPFFADLATTVVANGKLEVAKRKGLSIPEGYAQDANGNPTTSADALKEGGTMLPLGGSLTHSSYKGYALGAAVDIFTGVLSGANFGPWVPPFVPFLNQSGQKVGKGIGHFVGAWSVDAFMDVDEFKTRMDQWIERFANSTPSSDVDKVLIPGQKEAETQKYLLVNGIDVNPKVWEALVELDLKYQLKKIS